MQNDHIWQSDVGDGHISIGLVVPHPKRVGPQRQDVF